MHWDLVQLMQHCSSMQGHLKPVPLCCCCIAGQGEFGAVGFSYDAPAESSLPSRAGGPVEDLGEEASSESDSGERCSNADCLPAYSDRMVPGAVIKQAALKLLQLHAVVHVAHLETSGMRVACTEPLYSSTHTPAYMSWLGQQAQTSI